MILTITFNPAIDKTIKVSGLKVDGVNRVDYSRSDAGGKGINVSKTIRELKGESIALGFIGGKNGDMIQGYLNEAGIRNDFVRVSGETRMNTKIVDTVNNTFTDINESGPAITADKVEALKSKIGSYLKENDILILSGSVSAGVEETIYKEIIELANSAKAKVILDAERKLFLEGIKAGPFMVKPNIDELETAFNKKIEGEKDLIETAKELLQFGIRYVVVSLGGEGSVVVSSDKVIKAKGMRVEVKSTVGAGDSMVGALAVALERGYDIENALKFAAATSTATVMTEGSQTGKLQDIQKIIDKIEISFI